MIPAEVWAGLALFFGAIWVLVRVVDSRRTAAKVRVTADTVPTAYRLTKTFLGLVPAHSDTLGDAARLPEDHRRDRRRRGHGGGPPGVPHIRRSIPSGVHSDAGRHADYP